MSNFSVDWSNLTQINPFEPVIFDRNDLLSFCDDISYAVVFYSGFGLVLSIFLLFYFGRLRGRVLEYFGVSYVSYLDRALIFVIALLFAFVFARSLYFG